MFSKRKAAPVNQTGDKFRPIRFREPDEGEHVSAAVRKLSLITAIAVTIAVIAIVYSFLVSGNAQSEIATLRDNTKPAVFTTTTIPQGTSISSDMLTVLQVPATFLNAEAIGDTQDLIGKTALYGIAANSQVTVGMLSTADNTATLASSLEEGNVAISVSVDSESGLAGLIRQNDYVDILSDGVMTVQNVRVAALDNNLSGPATQYATVTVEVTPGQAIDIQQAQAENPLRLVLRPTVERASAGV